MRSLLNIEFKEELLLPHWVSALYGFSLFHQKYCKFLIDQKIIYILKVFFFKFDTHAVSAIMELKSIIALILLMTIIWKQFSSTPEFVVVFIGYTPGEWGGIDGTSTIHIRIMSNRAEIRLLNLPTARGKGNACRYVYWRYNEKGNKIDHQQHRDKEEN